MLEFLHESYEFIGSHVVQQVYGNEGMFDENGEMREPQISSEEVEKLNSQQADALFVLFGNENGSSAEDFGDQIDQGVYGAVWQGRWKKVKSFIPGPMGLFMLVSVLVSQANELSQETRH